jgi:hypothetical protein
MAFYPLTNMPHTFEGAIEHTEGKQNWMNESPLFNKGYRSRSFMPIGRNSIENYQHSHIEVGN